jgi:hypothetical protein
MTRKWVHKSELSVERYDEGMRAVYEAAEVEAVLQQVSEWYEGGTAQQIIDELRAQFGIKQALSQEGRDGSVRPTRHARRNNG